MDSSGPGRRALAGLRTWVAMLSFAAASSVACDSDGEDQAATGGAVAHALSEQLDADRCERRCEPGFSTCEDGQVCKPFACGVDDGRMGGTACVVPGGTAVLGQRCTRDLRAGRDDCAAGGYCLPDSGDPSDAGAGICMPLCSPSIPKHCAQLGHVARETCVDVGEGGLHVCARLCDPIDPTCPVDELCVPTETNFVCRRPAPGLSRPAALYAECSPTQACRAGAHCIRASLLPECRLLASSSRDAQCCAPLCEVGRYEELCASSGATCIKARPLSDGPHTVLGVCAAP